MRGGVVFGVLVVAAGVAQADVDMSKIQMEDGEWEMTATMTMNGQKVPPQTTKSCMTKAEMTPERWRKQMPPDAKCTSDHSVKAGTMSWKLSCTTDASTMTMSGKIAFKGKTFKGDATLTASGKGAPDMKGAMTMVGKRLGACPAAAPAKDAAPAK